MDIKDVIVTEDAIEDVLDQSSPGEFAFTTNEACEIYKAGKPLIMAAIYLLRNIHPKSAKAVASMVVILDAICGAV